MFSLCFCSLRVRFLSSNTSMHHLMMANIHFITLLTEFLYLICTAAPLMLIWIKGCHHLVVNSQCCVCFCCNNASIDTLWGFNKFEIEITFVLSCYFINIINNNIIQFSSTPYGEWQTQGWIYQKDGSALYHAVPSLILLPHSTSQFYQDIRWWKTQFHILTLIEMNRE